MKRVHVIAGDPRKYKTRAFTLPIHRYKQKLVSSGVDVSVHYERLPPDLVEVDAIIIQDLAAEIQAKSGGISGTLERLRSRTDRLIWYDTGDSSWAINATALAHTDIYLKKQLLADRSKYVKPMVGGNILAESMYPDISVDEQYSQVQNPLSLDKLRVGWNIGFWPKMLAPYRSQLWQSLAWVPQRTHHLLPYDRLFEAAWLYVNPKCERRSLLNFRMNVDYNVEAVHLHRKRLLDMFDDEIESEPIHPLRYIAELRRTQMVISPFGYGEICHRDFEAILCGATLIKPSMDHLETWPPIFQDQTTYVPVEWDWSDLIERVEDLKESRAKRLKIAETAQKQYREYLISDEFVEQFNKVIFA